MQSQNSGETVKKEKWQFKGEKFEGPLDLLLYLIQENKVDIYDIPIAEITEQFLEYINANKAEIDEVSDFYLLAADLLLIKSKMLLPVEVEFDEEYEDPRQELVERLIEYQKFKKYTDLLSGNTTDRFYIPRKDNPFMVPFDDQELFKDVTLNDLFITFRQLLEKVSPSKVFNIYEEVSVNEKITLINELLETRERITISDIIIDFNNPLHIICSFMAILEATKHKMILIRQDVPNGEIYIFKRPQDWDENLAELYDRQYDELLEKGSDEEITPDESGFVDDSLNEDDNEDEDDVFIGDEEEVDLEDDEEDE